MQKLDPYLNVDPGTMSPYQHGEVYVTVDGAETDLDLGHYERFGGVTCNRNSNYTSGSIYRAVISREREGGYLGKTVQVIPHITDEIKAAIRSLDGDDVDIAITEIGGTVGDIESCLSSRPSANSATRSGARTSVHSPDAGPIHQGRR